MSIPINLSVKFAIISFMKNKVKQIRNWFFSTKTLFIVTKIFFYTYTQ